MNNWKDKIANIGNVAATSSRNFSFELANTNLKIKSAESTCTCTDLKIKGNILTGKFTAKSIPKHLKNAGINKQTVIKSIKVLLYDPIKMESINDILTVKAEVYE